MQEQEEINETNEESFGNRKEESLEVRAIKALNLSELTELCYEAAFKAGWYHDKDGNLKEMNRGERLMLITSELAECMEGERKNLMDDKLPHRKMAEVELADAIIRICDYAGHAEYDLAGAVAEKFLYNQVRPDHKREHRNAEGGKQF